jgi:hypothetical protein
MFIVIFSTSALTIVTHAAGKIYEPQDPKYGTKKQYTKNQLINRSNNDVKKYTTCRLAKRIKSKHTGLQACVYRGGNRTFELMYEKNCPNSYKCVYNPGQPEPNIDDIIDSLNQIKK